MNDDAAGGDVRVDFTLAVGGGELAVSVEVPKARVTLTQLLPILQSIDNAVVEKAVERVEGVGLKVSCRAGCGACCRQLVPLSIFEAEALSQWIDSLPFPQQQAIEQRFHRALLSFRDAGMLERILAADWSTDFDAHLEMAVEYLHLGVPCPFLVEESCSIHPIRPLICREYLVTSPAEFCRNPARNQVAGVHLDLKLSGALYRMGDKIESDGRGWIPLIFLLAWKKSKAHPGEVFSGAGPDVLYQFISALATLPDATPNQPDRDQ